MRKILLMSFLMTFTLLLGVTSTVDARDMSDDAEQAILAEKLKAHLEYKESLKTLALPYQVPGGMILSQPGSPGGGYPSILVDCPPNGIPEGEPDCYFNYDDFYNSGCNSDSVPVFLAIAGGDTICGRTGVFQHEIPGPPLDTTYYRDTDWYRIEVTVPAELTWAATGDFPVQLLLIDAGSEDCEDYDIVTSDVAAAGDTVSVSITTMPGVFWLWIGPDDWYVDLLCDGSGAIGNEYVAWATVAPTPPCQVDTDIGNINSMVPYADLGATTCGSGHDYDGPETCITPYLYNSGEDHVYKFTVSEAIVLDIILDPISTQWTSLILDDFCPPEDSIGGCIATSGGGNTTNPHGFEQVLLMPGTYWLYVDTYSPPDCIPEYDLYIVQGVQTVGLGVTDNILDCGVSNFGPLGETDAQGNTYGWSGNPPANFAGTFVMGNAADRMFSYYNTGVTDCYEYNGVTGLDMSDPYHPTSRYDDNGALGGLTIEYCGHGYTTAPENDIFVHSFKLTNTSGTAISNFYAGVYFDWDIGDADSIWFDWTNNVIIQAPLPTDDTVFYGLCLANAADVGLNSMTGVSQQDHIYPTGPDSGGWRMDVLYGLMSAPGDSIADSMYTDMSSLLSSGPHTIADGDSLTINIAVVGGSSLTDVQSRAATAAGLVIPDCNVGEPPPPIGRCCYESGVDTLCADNLESECTSLSGYDWNRYLNCTDHPCVIAGCDYVTGDVNGSNSYNGLDVTYSVSYFKGGNPPMCAFGSCPIPPCDNFYYCGDVNGSCSFNGLDVTYSVAYFKGGPGPIPCPSCPPIP